MATGCDFESHREHSSSNERIQQLSEIQVFVLDILSWKYWLFDWSEQKISTLVTIDSLLLGALFLAVDSASIEGWHMISLFCFSIVSLLISILISLWHVLPLMYSGRSDPENPRTSYGIEKYESNVTYKNTLTALSLEEMIGFDSDQIRGMNKNIFRYQRAIRWAAWMTILGLLPTVALVALTVV